MNIFEIVEQNLKAYSRKPELNHDAIDRVTILFVQAAVVFLIFELLWLVSLLWL